MKTTLRITLSMAAAIGLLVVLLVWTGTSPADVWHTIESLPLPVYLTALACHMGVYLMRALRFSILIPREARPTLGRSLIVSSAHNMASYVLPAKTGEASFVVYMRRVCSVPGAMGLASLVVARLLDGAVLCGGLALACLALSLRHPDMATEWLASAGTLLLALTIVFALFSARSDWLVRFPTWILRTLGLGRRPLGRKILDRATHVALALRSAGAGGRGLLAALVTVPIWSGVFAFYAILGPAMGLPDSIDFAQATFGSSLAMMSNLLPINGIAGFGTQETGWTFGFGLLGVPSEVATPVGAGVHLVQLFNVVAMGMVGHLAMGALSREGDAAGDAAAGD